MPNSYKSLDQTPRNHFLTNKIKICEEWSSQPTSNCAALPVQHFMKFLKRNRSKTNVSLWPMRVELVLQSDAAAFFSFALLIDVNNPLLK